MLDQQINVLFLQFEFAGLLHLRLEMRKAGGGFMEHLLVDSLLVIIIQLAQKRVCFFLNTLKSNYFTANFFNECLSAGWTPQSFTSSRKNRAEVKQQSILNFLDDDEKAVCFFFSHM